MDTLIYVKSLEVAEHDTNEIVANIGFVLATTGIQEIRLRGDTTTQTVTLTAGVFYPFDLKLLHTGSASATALVFTQARRL